MVNTVRVGIVGCGGISQANHMPAFAALAGQCELVAVCDVDEDVARSAAASFGATRVYRSYRDLLADDSVQAVVVATPNRTHAEITLAALHAGMHVLCEKPLGMNADECREICRVARERNRVLQVGMQLRFGGPARFMKEFVDAGEMGRIYYARAQALRRRGVPSWGTFIDKQEQGGGPLVDIGVHILDLTLFLMGYPEPVSAFGQTWNQLGVNPNLYNAMGDYDRSKFTVEDMAVATIRFADGAVVTLESSYMANIGGNVMQTQLLGERSGAIVKPAGGADAVQIYTERARQLLDCQPANVRSLEPQLEAARAFVQSIAMDRPSQVPPEHGLILAAIFDAVYRSAETGRSEPVHAAIDRQGG